MTSGRNLRGRWVGRVFMPLILAVAGGLGAGAALIGPQGSGSAEYPRPQLHQGSSPPDIIPNVHQGYYTYSAEPCATASRVDPITVIFHGSFGHYADVRSHAALADHGGWNWNGGANQYFSDHYDCEPMNDDAATLPDWLPINDRWHMRYNEGPDYDPVRGWYTVASPHFEDLIWDWPWDPPIVCHAVKENDPVTGTGGGFNMGRDEITTNWSWMAGDTHYLTWWEYWGNIQRFQQCDGGYAWSNGIVDYISMPSGGWK